MADTLSGFNLQSAGFSDTVRVAIIRDVIKMLRADAVYAIPESVIPLQPDAGGGNSFVRKATVFPDIPAANSGTGSVLAEGVPPSPRKLAEDSMSVTVQEVGDYVPVFSQAAYQYGQGRAVAIAVDKVARMQFLLWDNLAKSIYNAGTTALFGGSTATSTATLQSGNVLTTAMVDELVTRARENDLQPFGDGLYRIVSGPRAFKALFTEAAANGGAFVNAANLGTVGDLTMGTIGDYHGARFVSAGSRAMKTSAQTGPAIPAAGTAAIAATDVVTTTGAHGLVAGNQVRVVTITGGAGLAAATNYFVVSPTSTTFKLAATLNGAAIDITTDSSAIALAYVNDVFKSILIGKGSIALSDPGSVENIFQPGGGPADPLRQTVATVGFKGFIGGALVSLANFSDGAGALSPDVVRSLIFETVGL